MKIKKELYIFLVSVIFTIFYDLYYLSNNFRDSVWDTFKRNFLDIENLLVGLIFIAIGYIFFRIIFFIAALFLRKKDFVFQLKTISISVFICLLIYIVNDQLILTYAKGYEWIHHYEPVTSNSIKIDSSNFFNYTWQIKAWDDDNLVDETINFEKDSVLILIGKSIVCDRLYLIRKVFGINREYTIKGKWKYGNKTFPPMESGDYPHSIQIKDSSLYLDIYF